MWSDAVPGRVTDDRAVLSLPGAALVLDVVLVLTGAGLGTGAPARTVCPRAGAGGGAQ
ncbi:hypothetical protein ACF1BE_13380 [Streptomyces sp. NPDC014991]|uniref:hypothetical protein n=1 Tax=Streptomyces sp. NPDC014991 TaxID=3364935 RepID=UPI003700EE37